MTQRSIIVGIWGRRRSDTSRSLSSTGLCRSTVHKVQCGPGEPSWSLTQIWVEVRMPDYCLNWIARSNAIQEWLRCQWCSSPTRRCPNRSRGPFGHKSAMEHWPFGTNCPLNCQQKKPQNTWPSHAIRLYYLSLPVGLQGYILYRQRAVVCRF